MHSVEGTRDDARQGKGMAKKGTIIKRHGSTPKTCVEELEDPKNADREAREREQSFESRGKHAQDTRQKKRHQKAKGKAQQPVYIQIRGPGMEAGDNLGGVRDQRTRSSSIRRTL